MNAQTTNLNLPAGFDANRAVTLGREVLQAELYDSGIPAYSSPNGYTIVGQFYGNDLKTDLTMATSIVPFGYVAQQGNDYIVAIRGTEQIVEWIQDAFFGTVACPYNAQFGQTEDGFTDIYTSLVVDASGTGTSLVDYLMNLVGGNPSVTLTIAGHSLGSALTTLLALDFASRKPQCALWIYLFASPSAGDETFANAYNGTVPNTWNIAIQQDLITQMPPTWDIRYTPVQKSVILNASNEIEPNLLCDHHLRSYMHLLDPSGTPLDPECVFKPGLATFLMGTVDKFITNKAGWPQY